NGCAGTFTHLPDADNYSQEFPQTPRITSRFLWGNWYGHPEGLWSFVGSDVDGSASARYTLSPAVKAGENPVYERKRMGCFGSRPKCLPLDIDGDGKFEMVSKLYQAPFNTGFIVDLFTGQPVYKPDAM